MDIIKEREELFDGDFNPKVQDIDRIKAFCKELSEITNIQTCTDQGALYEYLPKVYNSAVNKLI